MKNLLRLSVMALALGALGASACSSCSPAAEDASTDPALGQQSYKCGPGTHLVGSVCVGDTVSTTGARATTPLNTSGNN